MYFLLEAEDAHGDLAITLRPGESLYVYPGLLLTRVRVAENLGELCQALEGLRYPLRVQGSVTGH